MGRRESVDGREVSSWSHFLFVRGDWFCMCSGLSRRWLIYIGCFGCYVAQDGPVAGVQGGIALARAADIGEPGKSKSKSRAELGDFIFCWVGALREPGCQSPCLRLSELLGVFCCVRVQCHVVRESCGRGEGVERSEVRLLLL